MPPLYWIPPVETFPDDYLTAPVNPVRFLERYYMDIKLGRYKHFKGNEYEVLGIAKHSETLEPMVVYRALYGNMEIWVRPASMWGETVEKDGYYGPRFIFIG